MNNRDDDRRKTELRVSKNGREYWWNADHYKKRIRKENERREREGIRLLGITDGVRSKPYCYDPKSPSYMRYWEKKNEIRQQYPKWVHMNREQCREYYGRVWDLINYDEDYRQWKLETKTLAERTEDEWWEEKNKKDEDYDGHLDELK